MRRYLQCISFLLVVMLVLHAGMGAAAAQITDAEAETPLVEENVAAQPQPAAELTAELAAEVGNEETPAAEPGSEETLTDTVTQDAETEETEPVETEPEEIVPDEVILVSSMPHEDKEVSRTHRVPLYFQNDYPDNMYGYGTIASSGCSVTCLAMVATYMTGHTYLPDQLARYFGGRAINNMARLEYGATAMQLPYTKNTNWHHTLAALEEGKIAIVLLDENSAFTASQHFVVLTGVTEDGKVLVNDPNRDNYGNPNLALGFVDGFAPGYIANGYSGGWVFDVDAMPEEPFLYFEDEPERPEPRYPDIHLDQNLRHLLAKVIWVEARGESFEGQQAVAEVVLNRMSDPGFANTLEGVIYAEGQFRSVEFLDDAQPYQTQYEAIEAALYGPYVLPKDVFHFATFATNENIWGTIGGHIFCYRG